MQTKKHMHIFLSSLDQCISTALPRPTLNGLDTGQFLSSQPTSAISQPVREIPLPRGVEMGQPSSIQLPSAASQPVEITLPSGVEKEQPSSSEISSTASQAVKEIPGEKQNKTAVSGAGTYVVC